jgi:hypothetical protein
MTRLYVKTLLDDVVCKTPSYRNSIDLHVMYVLLYICVMDIMLECGFDVC